jgi:hypothetical protein
MVAPLAALRGVGESGACVAWRGNPMLEHYAASSGNCDASRGA